MGAIARMLGVTEERSTPLGGIVPGTELFDVLTGNFGFGSKSGETVNSRTALGYAAFWRGIAMVSADTAKTPLIGYKRLFENGEQVGKAPDKTLPAFKLLRRKPNTRTKTTDFIGALTGHMKMPGNGYAHILRNNGGVPLELLQLDPFLVNPMLVNGELWYFVSPSGDLASDVPIRVPAEDMFHIKGFGFDGISGYDVLRFHRETIGGALARRNYSSFFFANNSVGDVVLEHPGKIERKARENIRKSIEDVHKGNANAHKLMILWEGMTAKNLSIDARKSQLIELQGLDTRQIANIIGVPPHKLGDPARTSFNSLEQEDQSYLDQSLDPIFVQWETECDAKLLTQQQIDNDSHFFEFKREAVIRLDHETETKSLIEQVNNGLLSLDEARAIKNRGPLPDGLGEGFRMPANLTTIGEDEPEPAPVMPFPPAAPVGEPEPEPDPNEDDERQAEQKAAHRQLLVDVLRRMHKLIGDKAVRAAKKPDTFIDWIDNRMDQDNRAVFIQAVGPVLRTIKAMPWSDVKCDIDSWADGFFNGTRNTLLLAAECKSGELVAAVQGWTDTAESRAIGCLEAIM